MKELDAAVTAESMSDLMRQGDISLRHLTDARLAIEKLVLIRSSTVSRMTICWLWRSAFKSWRVS